jgi:hypothetical protein
MKWPCSIEGSSIVATLRNEAQLLSGGRIVDDIAVDIGRREWQVCVRNGAGEIIKEFGAKQGASVVCWRVEQGAE